MSGKLVVCASLLVGLLCAVFLSSFTRGGVDEPAITMYGAPSSVGMSCPRPGGLKMSVNAMQDSLKKNGIPTTPLTRFALTQYAAMRDVSMAAQAKEEFLRLDSKDRAMVMNLGKEVVVRSESVNAKDMAGAIAPLGFFDPAGFGDGRTKLAFLRSAELKHGRVCMLGSLGFIVSEKFHPIFDAWGDGPYVSAVASHFAPTAMKNFWGAFLILCGAHEYYLEFSRSKSAAMDGSDFGFDPLGLKPSKPADLLSLQNKEISNGRLAMLATAGMIAQELVTGKKIF